MNRLRHWVKVRFEDSPAARDTVATVERWKAERANAYHMLRAIRLYASLMRGETDELNSQFPFLLQGVYGRGGEGRTQHAASLHSPVVTMVEQSEEDELADFFGSMGLDDMEVGNDQ